MTGYSTERTAVFIDGANVWPMLRDLGWEMDYKRLYEHFAKRSQLIRCYYYTALPENEHGTLHRMCEMLSYNGFTCVTKNIKIQPNRDTGGVDRKGNMDIEMVVDMMKLAPHLDNIVLATGDGDFRYAVQALQDQGKRVSLLATEANGIKTMSLELRRQCDEFMEINFLKGSCAMKKEDRAEGINVSLKVKAPAHVG